MNSNSMTGGRLHRALVALDENPQLLDHARGRFSESPPSYRSPSGATTMAPSPGAPMSAEERREDKMWKLEQARQASRASNQFQTQTHEELQRVLKANDNGTEPAPIGVGFHDIAYENIRKLWTEQGIWRNDWRDIPMSPWKHEQPLELDPGADQKNGRHSTIFFSMQKKNTDEDVQRAAERKAILIREHEASRPFHQFLFWVSKEHERLLKNPETSTSAVDIGTRAYENVKSTWIRRKIWNRKWAVIPGDTWKHEEPLDELDWIALPSLRADPQGNPDPATVTAPPPPFTHEQASSHMDPFFGVAGADEPPGPRDQEQTPDPNGPELPDTTLERISVPNSVSGDARINPVMEFNDIGTDQFPVLQLFNKTGPSNAQAQPATTPPPPPPPLPVTITSRAQKRRRTEKDTVQDETRPRRSKRLESVSKEQRDETGYPPQKTESRPKRKSAYIDNRANKKPATRQTPKRRKKSAK